MQPVSQDRLVGSEPSESASLAEPPMLPEAPAIQYDAFISYSHAADGRLAPALRSGLQRFATPWRVFRLTNPVRSLRIFQDTASLSASPELWPTIERALMASDWFVLLASPDAAASPWVGKEVNFWCRHKSRKRLLIVQTDGEITWNGINDFDWTKTDAIPETLSGAFREEPRWVDARFARTEKQATLRDPRFRDLIAELAAPLRGIPKDDLIGEDIRQHRRLNFWRNTGIAFLTALLIVATSAAVIAVQQRNEAERNFRHAVDTADTLVTEVARRLEKLAGIRGVTADTAREVLTKAEQEYRTLMSLRPDSPNLQNKQAVMLMAFADTYAALGNTEEQAKRAQEARKLMQSLALRDPGNRTWQGDLAISHCTVGHALKVQNKPTDALAAYRSGQMLLERLTAQDPSNTRWKRGLMGCYGPMADLLYRQGDQEGSRATWHAAKSIVDSLSSQELEDAQFTGNIQAAEGIANFMTDGIQWANKDPARHLAALRASQASLEGLLKDDPDNPQRQGELASIYDQLGDFEALHRDLSEALEAYRKARHILEPLAGQDPKNSKWQEGLIWSYKGEGKVLTEQNDGNGALKAHELARARLESLVARDPTNVEWQYELADNYWLAGQARATQGDYNAALAAYRIAQQRLGFLLLQTPTNINWQYNLISLQDTIAAALLAIDDAKGALTEFENSKNRLAQLPGSIEVQSRLADQLSNIASIKNSQGEYAPALEDLHNAQAILERLINDGDGENRDFHYMKLMGIYNNLGDVHLAQGDVNSARTAYLKVQTTIEDLMTQSARGQIQLSRVSHFLRAELVKSHYGVAKIFQAERNFAGMLDAYRAGQAIAEPLADQGSNNIMWQSLLGAGYGGSGIALVSQGDYARALEEFRHNKAILEHLIGLYPNDPKQPLALAFTQQSIGGLLSLQGDQAGAVEAFRQSVALLREHLGTINNGKSKLASALGSLSGHYLLAGHFAKAKAAAEEGYSLDQTQIGILIDLAHAEMFLGQTDAAMELHMQHLNDAIPENGNKTWREVVADDLAALKKAGLENPNMMNIEQLMTKKD